MLVGLLPGCSTINSLKPWEDSRIHAEEVFRHQNQVSSQLLMLIVDHHDDEQLIRAERRLLEACQPLNHMAIRRMKDQSTNLLTRVKTRLSVNECEHVTRDVEQLLKTYQM